MTKEQIDRLIVNGTFPDSPNKTVLIETHISWVLLGNEFAYKIKKPVRYSFLDFSTLERREFYCRREVILNNRFSADVYIQVLPVTQSADSLSVGGERGEIIDYAVQMRKLDNTLRMDVLLGQNKVSGANIIALADRIAEFHNQTSVVKHKDIFDVADTFRDLLQEKDFLGDELEKHVHEDIVHAVAISDSFVKANRVLLQKRLKTGLFRDCHGDLHSRNIFLLPKPLLFDCIEFNDKFRRIDVLNEVAFLAMDLDSFGRRDLSDLLVKCYKERSSLMTTGEDEMLFLYYKSYRANVRVKVNSLRAKSCQVKAERAIVLNEAKRYVHLMMEYLEVVTTPRTTRSTPR